MRQRLLIITDGAVRGNPSARAAYGVHVERSGVRVYAEGVFLGAHTTTNNEAEYAALERGLVIAAQLIDSTDGEFVVVRSDSALAVNQSLGAWRVKSPNLFDVARRTKTLVEQVRRAARVHGTPFTLEHRRREYTRAADALANRALDRKQSFTEGTIEDARASIDRRRRTCGDIVVATVHKRHDSSTS